jgi:hypothetical protein
MMDIRTTKGGSEMSSDLGYSEDDLVAELQECWGAQIAAAVDDPFADPPPATGTIFEVIPVIDSLAVVTVLVTIEKHVNFEVPVSIIKPGGYESFDEMIGHLLPAVRVLAAKKHKRERQHDRSTAHTALDATSH